MLIGPVPSGPLTGIRMDTRGLRPWGVLRRMLLDCLTWAAMFGNGARTGATRVGDNACCVVRRGTTLFRVSSHQRIFMGIRPAIGAATSASVVCGSRAVSCLEVDSHLGPAPSDHGYKSSFKDARSPAFYTAPSAKQCARLGPGPATTWQCRSRAASAKASSP
jgi:hypothetical protein